MKITIVMTKKRRRQHHPALKRVLVQIQPRHQDGHADAAHKSRAQSRIHRLAQVIASNFGKIRQGNSHDQGRLNPLTQRNYEGLQHLRVT